MANKCQQCGLVNWDYDEFCKRCSASLYTNTKTPSTYKWYVVYCVIMALLYLVTAAMGIVFLVMEPESPEMNVGEMRFMGVVILIMGVVFLVPYAAAPFLPRKSWVWIFGLVLICIGLTSACLLPICIPLLIFWLKPEMKEFYNRTGESPLTAPPPPPQWS